MKKLNQQGAAAIISVVIFSIIITVVVTAYLRSAIAGQVEALNFDYGTRAYYSAEAGIQDALRALDADPAISKDSCVTFLPSSPTNTGDLGAGMGLSYTCQLINSTPSTVNFDVNQDINGMSRMLPKDLTGLTGDFNLVVRWSKKSESVGIARPGTDAVFPSQNNWSGNSWHPALRVSLLSYPKNNSPLVIDQRLVFLNPLAAGPVSSPLMQPVANLDKSSEEMVQPAQCYDSGGSLSFGDYLCQKTFRLSGFDLLNRAFFVRVHSLYASTGVELFLTSPTSNEPVQLTGSVVQVDVTGKAGSTFRRIRQTFNLNNGVILDNLPDAAVVGGDGICKHYSITDDPIDGFENLGLCL
jgi:Tfp pilus assembly protein PilX